MRICAIHQPNYFPWLGYFDKIRIADVFVFLDGVDYPKSGNSMGSWCNRVKLNIHGEAKWCSCPVVREHGKQVIKSVCINDDINWREKLLVIIAQNYPDSRNYADVYPRVEELINYSTSNLADFNINAIISLSKMLGIEAEWVRDSELDINGASTQRLVDIASCVGADVYLTGGGSAGYLDENIFSQSSIELKYQEYKPVQYGGDEYLPGLSIIDYLMNRAPNDQIMTQCDI